MRTRPTCFPAQRYLQNTAPCEWNTLTLLEALWTKFEIYEADVEFFKHLYKQALQKFIGSKEDHIRSERAKELLNGLEREVAITNKIKGIHHTSWSRQKQKKNSKKHTASNLHRDRAFKAVAYKGAVSRTSVELYVNPPKSTDHQHWEVVQEYVKSAMLSIWIPVEGLQLYCTGKLDDGKRLEDWLRIHVLGKICDTAFLYSKDREVIRSEGKLKLHQNLSHGYKRVDFILRGGERNLLIGEEKPAGASRKSVMFDREKCRALRELCLLADAQQIPEEFHVHLENLSMVWHGFTCKVYGSRLVYYMDKTGERTRLIIHYHHDSLHIPSFTDTNNIGHQFSTYFDAMLRLQILVEHNASKFDAIKAGIKEGELHVNIREKLQKMDDALSKL
ncbi:hypothetical protein BJV82DRAFT_664415 [Fennellomyces sp. T-0311]|nr:hypothetical protein BJV82DRAFT_664415 [Fennellomyces sp. T-0311]